MLSIPLCLLCVVIFDGLLFSQSEVRLEQLYLRQFESMPKTLAVTTKFRSMLSEEEFTERYKTLTTERRKRSSPEEIETICRTLKIPSSSFDEHFSKLMSDGLRSSLQDLEIKGKHTFFRGDTYEIRSSTIDGKLEKVLQYGVNQPLLEAENPNRWVIRLEEKKGSRSVLLSESKVALLGMLPLGVEHKAIDQKYSSGFNELWDGANEIVSRGEMGGAVFSKKHPAPERGAKDSWLVCLIESPGKSVIPRWIARVNTPGKTTLSKSEVDHVVESVNSISKNQFGLLPQAVYIHSITWFEGLAKVGEFENYPKSIRYTTYMDWTSSKVGFTEAWPFESFQLDVLDIDQDPKVPQNIPVEKGDSFYDYDSKRGWIIGEETARIAKSTSRVRFFLWLAAGITSIAVVALWIRRRRLYA